MKVEFSVKSVNFKTYQRFKKECEIMGYRYNSDFVYFEEDKMANSDCLYFADDFCDEVTPNNFSFSNSDDESVSFDLDIHYNSALDFAKQNILIEDVVNPLQINLTKREIFAMSAMQGILANTDLQRRLAEEVIQESIIYADELLKQLEQK